MGSTAARTAIAASLLLAMSICMGCGTSSSDDGPADSAVDATARSPIDGGAGDGVSAAGDATADAFVPFDAGCAAQLEELDAAFSDTTCSICIQNNCTFFTAPCSASCTCVDATLALLGCVKIAANRSDCVGGLRSSFTPDQVSELLVCEGICDKSCGGGDDDDDSGASLDAGEDDGGGDAS